MSGNTCCLFSCPNNSLKTRRSNDARLFGVPFIECYARQWREWIELQNSPLACNRKRLFLCERHFKENCFLPNNKLAIGALPTIAAKGGVPISNAPSTPDQSSITLRDILDTSPGVLTSYAPNKPDKQTSNTTSTVSVCNIDELIFRKDTSVSDKGINSLTSSPSESSGQSQVARSGTPPTTETAETLNMLEPHADRDNDDDGSKDEEALSESEEVQHRNVQDEPDENDENDEPNETDTDMGNALEPHIEIIKSEAPWDLNSSFGRCSPEWCAVDNADNFEPGSGGALNLSQERDPLADEDSGMLEDKNQLCRICGTKQNILSPICNDSLVEKGELTLEEKIESYLPLKLEEGLPMNICLNCRDMVESWHKLYVSCLAADTELRKKFAAKRRRRKFVPVNIGLEPKTKRAKIQKVQKPPNSQDVKRAPAPAERYNCRYCNEVFPKEEECKQHESKCVLEPVTCHVCGKEILQRNHLKSHLRKVHGPKSTECEICGKSFTSNSRLRCHMTIKHIRPAEPTEFCEPCCKVFCRPTTYKNHMATHDGEVSSLLNFKITLTEEDGGQTTCVCPVCETKFPDKLSLISHMNSTIKKQCLRCMKLIPSERFALIHKCKYWVCSHCEKKFNTRLGLDTHERTHEEEISLTCKTCGTKFTSHTDMVTHQESEGHSNKDTPCDSSSSTQKGVKQPMNFLTEDIDETKIPGHRSDDGKSPSKPSTPHRKSTSYKCKYCGETFPLKEDCVQHTNKCALEPAFCDVCGKTISKRCRLKKHIRNHKPTVKKWYVCEMCGKKLSTKSRLERHINILHVKEPKLLCEPCCKLFYSKASYLKHEKRHKNKSMKTLISKFASVQHGNEILYICPVCGEKFPDKMAVIIHLHVGIKKKCDTCKDIILNERHSLSHQCSKFICRYCGQEFKSRTMFASHVRNHKATDTCATTEACKICGGKFVNIYQHYATHKPPRFKCDECNKEFRWKESLRLHKQIHEGVTHTCTYCSKVFKLKRSLETHCRKMHPLENLAPEGRI